jgi:hypothetical protein
MDSPDEIRVASVMASICWAEKAIVLSNKAYLNVDYTK